MRPKAIFLNELRAHAGLVAVVAAYFIGWTIYAFIINSKATIAYSVAIVILFSVVAPVRALPYIFAGATALLVRIIA